MLDNRVIRRREFPDGKVINGKNAVEAAGIR